MEKMLNQIHTKNVSLFKNANFFVMCKTHKKAEKKAMEGNFLKNAGIFFHLFLILSSLKTQY